ncbi:hypothetical protein CPB85DRAFT_456171 [Mucidula mucida]|nr:hypothetical protein CPB85DRAFT_456171 [Mucidula mucida]
MGAIICLYGMIAILSPRHVLGRAPKQMRLELSELCMGRETSYYSSACRKSCGYLHPKKQAMYLSTEVTANL